MSGTEEKILANEENGKCEHCGSESGYWSSRNYWRCLDCNKLTIYYELTEFGKRVLKELSEDDILGSERRNPQS